MATFPRDTLASSFWPSLVFFPLSFSTAVVSSPRTANWHYPDRLVLSPYSPYYALVFPTMAAIASIPIRGRRTLVPPVPSLSLQWRGPRGE